MNKNTKYVLIFTLLFVGTYLTFSIFFQENYISKSEVNIESDYTIDQVIKELNASGDLKNEWAFRLLSKIKKYENNIKSGSFYLEGEYRLNDLINIIRIMNRKVINLQIPENIRLIEDMIVLLEDSVGYERGELKNYLDTSDFLQKNNLTMETLPAFFIPNTYQIYEGLSAESFLYKMKKEYQIFWNTNRLSLCDSLGITQTEVSIIASIVEEEQDKRLDERSKIAGLYLNRLNSPDVFPFLQADPTVKFANKNFGIKQVLNKHLKIDNLYNTYKYKGLPPGPICIPSIQAIDAVLNYEKHDYYFMCAGSNGDGYHKFTSTNKEHNKNKKKFKEFEGFK